MRQRVVTAELMDDPELEPEDLRCALAGLGRLNAMSFASGALWRVVEEEARGAGRAICVLDIACANGGWVIGAAKRAGKRGVKAEFSGCDFNSQSIELAERRAGEAGARCSFFARDATCGEAFGEYDVVMASLFLHHLRDRDATTLLGRMARSARRAVVINDLVRSRLNLAMVAAASRMVSRSAVVHADAALSVRSAFTRGELLGLAQRAGLEGATIGFGGFGRMQLVWRRRA